MPLTPFQKHIAQILSQNRSFDNHLAGGAALHFQPKSIRYSNDLDYFQDSIERVASAFDTDQNALVNAGYVLVIEIKQPGYIRARVSSKDGATKIEWAHDSDWRFFPVVQNPELGFVLHPMDLAVNKVLTLAGRNEPRDFLDVMHIHKTQLSLGALCWAAAGKDPGFSPQSLLELLKRRGKFHQTDFDRLILNQPVDLIQLKSEWLEALDEAETFIKSRPANEMGCLYLSKDGQKFLVPAKEERDYQVHRGRSGGVLPRIV